MRAVDINEDSSKMCVGLRDGTIFTVDVGSGDKKAVMYSHSEGETWGLCVDGDSVWTGGDDNKVMKWNPAEHKMELCVKVTDRKEKQNKGRGSGSTANTAMSQQCRAVATNDSWFAISGNDGKVSVRAKSDIDTELHLLKEANEWNECMSFSPDGTMLAVGSHDNLVRIYSTSDFSYKGHLKGHSSWIQAFDWCCESKYIRSQCAAYEVLYFTVEDCKQDTSGRSNTTGTEWSSATVHFTWSNQAIFPSGTDGSHVNDVQQSPDGNSLMVGNDFGLVQLFRNPCRFGAACRSYRGHSEFVVRVAYNGDGS